MLRDRLLNKMLNFVVKDVDFALKSVIGLRHGHDVAAQCKDTAKKQRQAHC